MLSNAVEFLILWFMVATVATVAFGVLIGAARKLAGQQASPVRNRTREQDLR